jgi:bifunctional UDP-N-acetylglucosamine pyrophosphorylase/glucosamine-1-phosphate N-acetyltransferase
MPDLHVVVLAAGKGTRMKSALPKVLHQVAGIPMIERVLRLADTLAPASITLVVGHGAERVKAALTERPGLRFALQEPQLGTGHALLQAEPRLAGARGTLVLLSGDVPLLQPATLARLVGAHHARAAVVTVLTADVDRPHGYGRIVRRDGRPVAIVEERDATPDQRAIREINSGVYAFDLAPLFDALRGLGAGNAQGEYYLPDLVAAYARARRPVEAVAIDNPAEILGINSRRELAEVSAIVRHRKCQELMDAGVTIEDPATTYLGPDVAVGADTVIHPGVFLEGGTRVGRRCELHAGVRLVDTTVGDDVVINNFCVIAGAEIAAGARVGPFAHIRPASRVGEGARVGNFVELKKTTLGRDAKANHLTYLGDATIGDRVNVGAGTITCNYDGVAKHPTVIEDDAFIGSDTQLVAPVRVGRGAYVAAGSSIVEDVPPGALGIARARQANKTGWADRKKKGTGA